MAATNICRAEGDKEQKAPKGGFFLQSNFIICNAGVWAPSQLCLRVIKSERSLGILDSAAHTKLCAIKGSTCSLDAPY